jgi:transcriptional regulator GlxA family with amidase domain
LVSDKDRKQLPITVGILIFEQVEVLDVAGPFEVFSVARLNEERRSIEPSPFRILLLGKTLDQVTAVGGLRLIPDVTFDNCPELDLLIIPGGWGTRIEINDVKFLNKIADRVAHTKLTASVCTGSSLLGRAGLLDGREATTHWRAFDFLRKASPMVKVRKDVRFTLAEPVFTSAGVSAGIDLALLIVSHFFGTEIGVATARQMEYPYPQNDQRKYI